MTTDATPSVPKKSSRDKIFFLSDLHLGARYFDDPRAAERRVVAFLDSVKVEAKEIYLVGDVLDYWYEYRYVVPKGFVRFFGKIAELADSGVRITWLIGNHDIWIFDYLPSELGIEVVDGSVSRELLGKRFFITHGDDIDDRSFSFRLLRKTFRSRFCQRLYSAIHPRWTIPFALGWSRSSRKKGNDRYEEPSPVHLVEYSRMLDESQRPYDYYIYGHLHIVHREHLRHGEVIVLGDWISRCSYAVFDGREMKLLYYPS